MLEPAVVDLDARSQQQIFHRNRRKLHGGAAGIERREMAQIQAELARPNQNRFRPCFRRQRGRRQHRARDARALIAQIADHPLQILDVAQHRNAADGLAAVVARGRQNANRPYLLHRAAFDRAQQDLGVGRAAEDQRRRRVSDFGALDRAAVVEIAIGDARAAQKEHLQEPVEQDGDLAEKELAVDVGRQQHIVEHEQRQREHGRCTKDVVKIGNGRKAPLVAVQTEDEIDNRRIDDKKRQKQFEARQLQLEDVILEAHDEGQADRRHSGDKIVQYDQNLARRQSWQPEHSAVRWGLLAGGLYKDFAGEGWFQAERFTGIGR